jgi:hypothetical protein
MSKAAAIVILGFIVAFLPFTGFPNDVKTVFAVLAGFLIMALGFLARQERIWLMRALKGTHKTDAYTESGASYVAAQTVE